MAETKEIVIIDIEVFKNLSQMLQSSTNEDVQMALETIKNLNPCDEIIRLFLKKTTYRGRSELLNMIGQNQWNHNDLTMKEIYECIKTSKNSNIENIKKIYETLVVEHFQHLTKDYNFIEGKYKIIW
tara:strand:- start:14 stop:394 length:381 start_codon:yes stop_codon:yes gene_type:complete